MKYCLQPDWPAPQQVRACTTYRHQGTSLSPYDSWNLASHVGDDANRVAQNRVLLIERLALTSEPVWLDQVHGNKIINLAQHSKSGTPTADGSYTSQPEKVCAVMTADCLPVLITNQTGTEVAAVHAGWRGLAGGVVQQAIDLFTCQREDILVWLGPAIGPQAFEVGAEVRQVFVDQLATCDTAFKLISEKKYLADIYLIARQLLGSINITAVYGGDRCTYSESDSFFSYRRESQTGRMSSLIWIDPHKTS